MMSRKYYGFTLIELLVVIAIIGILATVVLVSLPQARLAAQKAKAKGEIRDIYNAIKIVETDSDKWPDGLAANQCGASYANNEICNEAGCAYGLFDAAAGLTGVFSESLVDPWGKEYFFDRDYEIGGSYKAVIGSFGPDGASVNGYDNPPDADDDVILIICP